MGKKERKKQDLESFVRFLFYLLLLKVLQFSIHLIYTFSSASYLFLCFKNVKKNLLFLF